MVVYFCLLQCSKEKGNEIFVHQRVPSDSSAERVDLMVRWFVWFLPYTKGTCRWALSVVDSVLTHETELVTDLAHRGNVD